MALKQRRILVYCEWYLRTCWATPGSSRPSVHPRISSSASRVKMEVRPTSYVMTERDSIRRTPAGFSVLSSGSTARQSLPGRASAWPRCSASSTGMVDASGRKARLAKARLFISRWAKRLTKEPVMKNKVIMLVEDNPDDEALTVRALKKNKIVNEVVVARDGVEALDYLFGEGAHAGRDVKDMPEL